MATTYFRGPGKAPASAANVSPSAAEAAAWQLFSAHTADQSALWFDVPSSRLYQRLGAADAASGAKLVDRCGSRVFVAHPTRNRHPFIINDNVTGRPVLCFGAGGAAPNDLNNTFSGVLHDALGDNAAGLFAPDTGWSLAAKVRVPANGATVNGVAFSTNTGGCVLGSMGATTADASSFLEFDQSNGRTRAYNQRSVGTTNQFYGDSTDRRDGLWHDYVITYDDVAGIYRCWTDGALAGTVTGCTTDIPSAAGSDQPMLGATTDTGGYAARFGGFLACLYWLPGPVLNGDDDRATTRALMATR
ncbi:hypothetical protein JI664_23210 [Rhodobacter sp. NTK016B]|uniref:hypothetical protein n=1 Tax=Rhodobacter sp. NTK016B TaxID=2759676 RepID=UPI001A8F049F|nr:hypothetical protein [Rhodobacter sp. NTK016B]MBN8294899.1 hypothetical protein [Rhodobacter sp. NTK016B]